MPKLIVFVGMLVYLAYPLAGASQQTAEAVPAAGETPPAVTAAKPAMPNPVMPVEVIFESSVGDVQFPHNVHLKFGCVACHHQIRAGELETPHPDYMTSSWISCQTCHDEAAQAGSPYYKCSNCHHSEPENIADETLSAKVVVHQSCWKCHKSGAGVEASAGCGDCHVKKEQQPEVPNG